MDTFLSIVFAMGFFIGTPLLLVHIKERANEERRKRGEDER